MINLGLLQRKFNVLYVLFSVPLHLSFSGLAAVLLEFMRDVGGTLTKTLLVLYVTLGRYISISPIRHGILKIQSTYYTMIILKAYLPILLHFNLHELEIVLRYVNFFQIFLLFILGNQMFFFQ